MKKRIYMMVKRVYLFGYYLWALLTPVHETNIWGVSLAWQLAGIAAR